MRHSELAEDILHQVVKKYRPGAADAWEIEDCKIYRQGNFTVALVNGEYVGVTKRNAGDDQHNPNTGRCTAITRAVKSMLKV